MARQIPAQAAGTERLLNLVPAYTGDNQITLTRAVTSGEVGGWKVAAQRRSRHDGQRIWRMACLRITAPDGRVLTIVAAAHSTAGSAHSPLSTELSPAIGLAFRSWRAEQSERKATTAVAAVFDAGWQAAGEGLTGLAARLPVQLAALGLPADEFHLWQERLGRAAISPRSVAWHIEAGFTADTAKTWYGDREFIEHGRVSIGTCMAWFRAGWTAAKVDALGDVLGEPPTTGWAELGPHRALLAARAGFALDEALDLVREDRFNEDVLDMLGGLRFAVNVRPDHLALLAA